MPLFYHKYVNYVLAHSVNYVIILYSLPLPLHRTSPSPQPSQSTSIVSPRTITLASLVNGEVLSPERIRANTGGIVTPPSLAPHQPSPPRTLPLAFRRVRVCVRLVGFASIAIVVVCGRCVLHRLFATTCKHPCLKPLGTHA